MRAGSGVRKMEDWSVPPEGDGEGDGERTNVVPPVGREVEHLASLEDAVPVVGLGEEGEELEIGRLNVDLGRSRKEREKGGRRRGRSQAWEKERDYLGGIE